MKDIPFKEIGKLILQLGVGTVLLLGGFVVIVCGLALNWEWPMYLIGGCCALVCGIIIFSIESVKEIIKYKNDIKKNETEIKKLTVRR